mmetsp:Transcript_21706/g.35907  ORF Transcript_21706/g.35907 Transcript_21706/m.35907 type:complete len:206 (-) Transcript_21706:123-740(-)
MVSCLSPTANTAFSSRIHNQASRYTLAFHQKKMFKKIPKIPEKNQNVLPPSSSCFILNKVHQYAKKQVRPIRKTHMATSKTTRQNVRLLYHTGGTGASLGGISNFHSCFFLSRSRLWNIQVIRNVNRKANAEEYTPHMKNDPTLGFTISAHKNHTRKMEKKIDITLGALLKVSPEFEEVTAARKKWSRGSELRKTPMADFWLHAW